MNKLFMILTACLFALNSLSAEKDPAISFESIISQDDEDCHSSCIIEVASGILCTVWKGSEGKGIWMSRFLEGQWSCPQLLAEAQNSICWSPVLAQFPNGEIKCFYRIGADPRSTISLVKSSQDGGLTWSDAEILPAGIVGPTKAKPVFDAEGNMICGSSVEAGSPDDALKATACWIEILSKEGRWSKYGPLQIPGQKFGCIEPALVFCSDGHLKLFCRDRSRRIGLLEGWIWTADSYDQGKTWSELEKTSLPNPDSGLAALSLDNGKMILIFNDSFTDRYPLTIALSEDDGKTWERLFNLEEESGEFPSAALTSEGLIHVTYAWAPPGKTIRQVKHAQIEQEKLIHRE